MIMHDLEKDILQTEILHRENKIEEETELMGKHEDQIEQDTSKILKKIHKEEMLHDEDVIEHEKRLLAKDEKKLEEEQGKSID